MHTSRMNSSGMWGFCWHFISPFHVLILWSHSLSLPCVLGLRLASIYQYSFLARFHRVWRKEVIRFLFIFLSILTFFKKKKCIEFEIYFYSGHMNLNKKYISFLTNHLLVVLLSKKTEQIIVLKLYITSGDQLEFMMHHKELFDWTYLIIEKG